MDQKSKPSFWDKATPFALVMFTQLITTVGAVQAIKTDISYINKSIDRHELEILELRRKIN